MHRRSASYARLSSCAFAALFSACARGPEPSAAIARAPSIAADASSVDAAIEQGALTHVAPSMSAPDLELASTVTASPSSALAHGTRLLREFIVWGRRCVEAIESGSIIDVSLTFARGERARAAARVEPSPSQHPPSTSALTGAQDCLRIAAAALEREPDELREAFEVAARLRVVRRPGGALRDPARLCDRDEDCRLVPGTCAGPAPAHALHARSLARRNAAALASRRCDEGSPRVTPAEPRCVESQCIASALRNPEWRTCRDDRDCAVLVDGRSFTAVSRSAAPRALSLSPGARAARMQDSPPTVRCAYHFCALRWVDAPAATPDRRTAR